MAFTYEIVKRSIIGNMKIEIWKYVSAGGSTGGAIVSTIRHVWSISLQPFSAAAVVAQHTVNETIPTKGTPLDGRSITIVTTANESGIATIIGS